MYNIYEIYIGRKNSSNTSSSFSTPFALLERWGVCLDPIIIPRFPLLLRITIYFRQVISLALGVKIFLTIKHLVA